MNDRERLKKMGRNTQAVYAGGLTESVYGEVSVPIFQSSTFAFPDAREGAARFAGEKSGFIYTRIANPTVAALEESTAVLENGDKGIGAATGMAAITSVFLSLLHEGAHVVATGSLYGSTRVLLEQQLSRFGVRSTFVDTSDLDALKRAVRPETLMVFVETPTNPTMIITDIAAAAEIAHAAGAVLVVDNTFASPHLQRPLELGADIVIHSLTKYINGHSDVLGGMIVTKDRELYDRIRKMHVLTGGSMDPHQAWLILRGLKTLPLRMERAQENARKLADFLKGHPKVTWVRYPGLPEHPQYETAKKQMDGFGSMLCFGVTDGLEGGITLLDNVELITLAVSLGAVETLIEHPASMTHASVPKAEREEAGITDDLVRLAVGCEDFEDLRDDLNRALNRIGSPNPS